MCFYQVHDIEEEEEGFYDSSEAGDDLIADLQAKKVNGVQDEEDFFDASDYEGSEIQQTEVALTAPPSPFDGQSFQVRPCWALQGRAKPT